MKALSQIFPQLVGPAVLIVLICKLNTPWNALHWIGLVITSIAAIFLLVARYQLGKSFSVSAQARQLVTRGLYSRIRNPIYVFSTVMILGLMIAYQNPVLLLVPLVLVMLQVFRARRESQVLEQAFGDSYREYRKRTWF